MSSRDVVRGIRCAAADNHQGLLLRIGRAVFAYIPEIREAQTPGDMLCAMSRLVSNGSRDAVKIEMFWQRYNCKPL
jgi:hypothetical protein